MKAAIFYGDGEIRVEERPVPEIGPNEVLVKIIAAGICGSDVIRHRTTPKLPEGIMFGHEYSGQIIKIGKRVENLSVGDRVGLEPLIGCGNCRYCLSGNYHLCSDLYHIPAFLEYQRFPASKVFKLPDHVSYEEASTLDCIAVAVHAMKLSNLKYGETAAVLGAGTIGLLTMQTAKAFGARTVLQTGTYDFQLKLAQEFGADIIVNVKKENLLQKITELTGDDHFLGQKMPLGFDQVFETVGGSNSPLADTLRIARRGGTVTAIGQPRLPVDMDMFVMKEVKIIGSSSYAHYSLEPEFLIALELLSSGKVNAGKIITHTFPLEKISEAFEVASDKKFESVKVIVKP